MGVHSAEAGVSVAEEVGRGALNLPPSQDHLQDGRFDVDQMIGMLAEAVREPRIQHLRIPIRITPDNRC